jgi:hypothetical protein
MLVILPSMSEAPAGSEASLTGVTLAVVGVMTLASEPSLMRPLIMILSPQGGAIFTGVLVVIVVGSRRGEEYWVIVAPEGVQMTITVAL